MITETSTKNELLTAIEEVISQMAGLMMPLGEQQVNSIPYENSWTAGQLFNHVTLSINGMAKAMSKESEPAERDPGEKIAGLKKAMLDFSVKMKSPDFIVPEDGPFEKQATIEELQRSFTQFSENTGKANLNDMVEGLPFGPVTKLEMLHFVLYHSQRHLHQMKNITNALEKG
ncbi:MAG: DinB family protein [Ferruginibacter sp.]